MILNNRLVVILPEDLPYDDPTASPLFPVAKAELRIIDFPVTIEKESARSPSQVMESLPPFIVGAKHLPRCYLDLHS